MAIDTAKLVSMVEDYHDRLRSAGIQTELLNPLVTQFAEQVMNEMDAIAYRDSLIRLVQNNVLTNKEARESLVDFGYLYGTLTKQVKE